MSKLHQSVVIATKNRFKLLERALNSVKAQSLKPERVVVVIDQKEADLDQIRYLGRQIELPVEVLANRRTPGASGAWNTAFDHLARLNLDPTCHVVSILDDDDWWNDHYLSEVHTAAQSGADVMAAAISRYDTTTPEGRVSSPPEHLFADDFLRGNPGIQGSNLSARLSTFLLAGLFDEALSSCTDRDLCIRLSDLQPVYQSMPGAVARHDTLHGYTRLSDKGGTAKLAGLEVFHAKWRRRMSAEQYEESCSRAQQLFDWSPANEPQVPVSPERQRPPENVENFEPITLIIGLIVSGSNPERCFPLLEGLQRLAQHRQIRGIEVVLLENGDASGFEAIIKHGRACELNLWPVDIGAQRAAVPSLPLQPGDITRQKPIAIARTLLQRFVYEASSGRNYAPAWILDDDFRLPDDLDGLVEAMSACRKSGIDVALGGNSGAAPVPASSLLRTQLVDITHFLQWASCSNPNTAMPDADVENYRWLRDRNDYHYDLTRNSTDRLETPFQPHLDADTLVAATSELLRRSERIMAGEAISRPVLPPVVCPAPQARDSCLRGGNTLVLDTTLLRDIPNMAPRVNGRPTRRSDMIWAANAKYLFGKSVKAVSLPMSHDRSMERADEDDTQRLVDDIVGYSFFRSYEETLSARSYAHTVRFSGDERNRIGRLTHKYATERLAAYRLSFWRVAGLTQVLSSLAKGKPWWLRHASASDAVAFRRFLELLQFTTDSTHLKRVETGVRESLEVGDFMGFLTDLEQVHPGHPAPDLPYYRSWVEQGRKEHALNLVWQRLGIKPDKILGMGAEGVVLRMGDKALKVFDRWSETQRKSAAPLVKALIDTPAPGALPDVSETYDWPEAFAIAYQFEESTPYCGGHGPQLITMLKSLHRNGWVHSNISPKNLRVTNAGLQLVDIGKSLELATPNGQEMMIRRAFLSWRFAHREDLVHLMRASLKSEQLPELTGWIKLKEAVLSESSKSRLNQHIQDRTGSLSPTTILDYGCGKPRESNLRWNWDKLTAFDIDPTLPGRWHRDAPNVPFWKSAQLQEAISRKESFDLILCSLVLCAVDNKEMVSILENIRQLTGEAGRVIIAVCDPAALKVSEAVDQTRHNTEELDPYRCSSYLKTISGSVTSRIEFHRSIEAYRRAFARAGLMITEEHIVSGFDAEHLEEVPEFKLFELAPMPQLPVRTSLLIKLCALESETALHQVRHLERQLSRPRAFDELVLLVDPHEGPFPRAHCAGNIKKLRQVTKQLLDEGVADREIDGLHDGFAAAEWSRRWTGQEAHHSHCANGQPTTSILMAFEQCKGDYILHADADILISRPDPSFDHIADAVDVFNEHPDAVTLSLAVNSDRLGVAQSVNEDHHPYRVEAMTGWIAKHRLLSLAPFPATVNGGRLNLPWHRLLDTIIRFEKATSLRRGSNALWFAAPDNSRKDNVDDLLLLMDRVESGYPPAFQRNQPLIQGTLQDWLEPKRKERLVVVICGRNVRTGAIDRCIASLLEQTYTEWGVILIDDASDDGSEEVLARARTQLGDRATFIRRRRRMGLLANTALAIRDLVSHPDTVIALLDLDDALADQDALRTIANHHRSGSDLTVGSMVRTDKQAHYPVNFSNPRANRGGNVWQHLRTFRKSLFDRIEPGDLKLDGDWVDLGTDWAFMLPMVEMARNPSWVRNALYLHEPSTCRPPEEKLVRERIIKRLIAKPSYRSRSLKSPGLTVLCYHRVLDSIPVKSPEALFHQRGMAVLTDTLRAQLREALRHYQPVCAADVLAAMQGHRALPEGALLVTIDDGYRDLQENAIPVMSQMGVEPAIFPRLPSEDGYPEWAPLDLLYVGRAMKGADTALPSFEWRERLLQLPLVDQLAMVREHIGNVSEEILWTERKKLYLSDQELRSLSNVAIGTHGIKHIRWTTVESDALNETLSRSLNWLKEIGGLPMASYPDGAFSSEIAKRLGALGFQAGFTLNSTISSVPSAYSIQRFVMPDDPEHLARVVKTKKENAAWADVQLSQ
jgi:glycosyltransferase involved in cell wall biosynthesis/SAM-dependent methyltransferase/peptidoglycan/xylan/chitin deacetylase (PgdA/CDA1 family)